MVKRRGSDYDSSKHISFIIMTTIYWPKDFRAHFLLVLSGSLHMWLLCDVVPGQYFVDDGVGIALCRDPSTHHLGG